MHAALYTKTSYANSNACPRSLSVPWTDELPAALQALVVTPTRFDEHHDYEIQAQHTRGVDAANTPCYSAFSFVLTRLRCDDDEIFYEAPVYAETRKAWRLVDTRWLVCHTVVGHFDCTQAHTSYSVSDVMPR